MAKYKSIVTTEVGLALVEDSAYMGHAIQFTALKTGNGVYDGTENLAAATDLKNVCQTFGVGSVSKRGSDILVRAAMNNSGVTAGYSITEIGLYATDQDTDTEVLYAIIVAESGNEDYFPPYSEAPTSITLEMYVGLTEAAEAVTFSVLPVEGAYVPVESFNEVLNGTTPVGDSNKLGGKGASEYALQTTVDNIQTTSTARLSAAGWYRVAQYEGSSNAMYGGEANSCTLTIRRGYVTAKPDFYKIEFISKYGERKFKALEAYTGGHLLTKIRYVYSGTTAYLEVYYSGSDAGSNTCLFTINNGATANFKWQAITPTLTEETVDGVTVTVTYDIPADASMLTDLDLVQFKGTESLSKSILEKALEVNIGVHNFKLNNTTDLPNANYKYSMATIFKRGDTDIQVVLWGLALSSVSYPPITNYYNSGSWMGWKTLFTTDGGTVGNGSASTPIVIKGDTSNSFIKFANSAGEVLGYLGFFGENTPVFLQKSGNTNCTILHTGNKPTGSYTGNGSATQRTIQTGSIGSVYLVRRNDTTDALIVSPNGYFGVADGQFVRGTDAYSGVGYITLKTILGALNSEGKTMEYHSL